MQRIPRYITILGGLLMILPLKSEPGETWTFTDAATSAVGLGMVVEGLVTLGRKGRVGGLQRLVGIPSYTFLIGTVLCRLAFSFPFGQRNPASTPRTLGHAVAAVCMVAVLVVCAGINLHSLLNRESAGARKP
jgi:hypothetical protein